MSFSDLANVRFCLVLAEDAIRSAIKDYRTKKSRVNASSTAEVSSSAAVAVAAATA